MGVYDTISFRCPKCGRVLYVQSKSGRCNLTIYKHTSVPLDVAIDANRYAPFKCACGAQWRLSERLIRQRIRLDIIKVPKKENE